jgi:hypothetical protein
MRYRRPEPEVEAEDTDFAFFRMRPVYSIPECSLAHFRDAMITLVRLIITAMKRDEPQELRRAIRAFQRLPLLHCDEKGDFDKGKMTNARCEEVLQVRDPVQEVFVQTRAAAQSQRNPLPGRNKVTKDPRMEEDKDNLPFVRKAVAEFVKVGRPGRGLQQIESWMKGTTVLRSTRLSDADVQAELSRLFPAPNEDDVLPAAEGKEAALQLTPLEVTEMLEHLTLRTAQSFSPWTNELLQQTCRGEELLLEEITNMFNLLLAGKGGDSELWKTSRLVMLEKQGGSWPSVRSRLAMSGIDSSAKQ